ncbi:MAG TPA: N-acetylmuramoyl-L-alanine amidase [Thermoanaerobaculia bacterium]
MKDRRFWASLAFSCLLLPVLVAAQGDRQQPPPSSTPAPPVGGRASVTLAGRGEIPVPVTLGANGPLFGLAPLAEELGGTLSSDESGESVTLRIGDTDVVIGIGSPIVTIGEKIVSLPQPTAPGEGGVQVPVELLQRTYGDLLGFSFDWRPETARLTISKRGAREIPVSVDVVHLQGVTTVVLQFPETPSYRVLRQSGQIEVQMLGDRLTPPQTPPAIQDPLVQGVTISPQQVLVRLMAGAEAESYILENPFRLVFDVHRPSSVATAPTAPRTAPAERTRGVRTIVIDPGHGGPETGAIGPSGAQEKELTLILARDLEALLESSLPVRVVLTRNEDASIAHDTRAAIANQNKADLFISIHLNSSLGTGAHGAETYFLSTEATNVRETQAAAEHEMPDAGDPAGGDAASADLELILWDLAQAEYLTESQRFANLVQRELNEALQLKDRGVKQAPFRVLKGAAMPAVLVELGFINNPDEEKKLQDAEYRSQLIEALARAVTRYKALVEGRELPPALQGQPQGQAPAGAPANPNPGRGAGSPP